MLPIPEPMLAWAAGFFDGEGSVQVTVNRSRSNGLNLPQLTLVVKAANTDRRALERLQRMFSGSIYLDSARNKPGRQLHQKLYHWQLAGQRAVPVCRAIIPYSVIKREQLELAVSFWDLPWRVASRKGVNMKARKRTDEQLSHELDLASRLRLMKRNPQSAVEMV